MKLDKNKLALAATGAMAVAYAVCAIFVAVAPEVALRFLGWIVHLVNLERATEVSITFGSFAGGLVPILLYTYAITWLFGWFYNRLLKSS